MQYHDLLVVPIIDNTAREEDLTESMADAMRRFAIKLCLLMLQLASIETVQVSVVVGGPGAAARRVCVGKVVGPGQGHVV